MDKLKKKQYTKAERKQFAEEKEGKPRAPPEDPQPNKVQQMKNKRRDAYQIESMP